MARKLSERVSTWPELWSVFFLSFCLSFELKYKKILLNQTQHVQISIGFIPLKCSQWKTGHCLEPHVGPDLSCRKPAEIFCPSRQRGPETRKPFGFLWSAMRQKHALRSLQLLSPSTFSKVKDVFKGTTPVYAICEQQIIWFMTVFFNILVKTSVFGMEVQVETDFFRIKIWLIYN